MARPFKCPYCGSSRTRGKGIRPTKTLGLRKIRLCKACGHKFTVGLKPLVLVKTAGRRPKSRGRSR